MAHAVFQPIADEEKKVDNELHTLLEEEYGNELHIFQQTKVWDEHHYRI
jgi:hypothetical protein